MTIPDLGPGNEVVDGWRRQAMRSTGRGPGLSSFEWVALATSTDGSHPVLEGVNVRGEILAATNGHVLHLAPLAGCALPEGTWHPRTLESVETEKVKFPDYEKPDLDGRPIIPEGEPTRILAEPGEVRLICKGASIARFPVSLPSEDGGRVLLSARYLRRALKGHRPALGEVRILTPNPSRAIKLVLPEGRIAVIMPLHPRHLEQFPHGYLELDHYIDPIAAPEPAPA